MDEFDPLVLDPEARATIPKKINRTEKYRPPLASYNNLIHWKMFGLLLKILLQKWRLERHVDVSLRTHCNDFMFLAQHC